MHRRKSPRHQRAANARWRAAEQRAQAERDAGMPEVQYRDLRRSCGTLMIRKGVPLHIVSKILGHSSTTITEKVYAHLHTSQMREGLGALTGLHRDLHRKQKRRPKTPLSA